MLRNALTVLVGATATYAYFWVFEKTIDLSHRLSSETTLGVIILSYFARLAVVAGILGGAVLVLRIDTFLTCVSFLVIYTMALLFNERRLITALISGQLPVRKE